MRSDWRLDAVVFNVGMRRGRDVEDEDAGVVSACCHGSRGRKAAWLIYGYGKGPTGGH